MGKHRPEKFRCTQCGSTGFDREGERQLRCRYCDSLYEITGGRGGREGGATLHIKDGANVIIGTGANIVVRGEVIVDRGAKVQIDGSITLIERGSEEKVSAAKQMLEKSAPGNE